MATRCFSFPAIVSYFYKPILTKIKAEIKVFCIPVDLAVNLWSARCDNLWSKHTYIHIFQNIFIPGNSTLYIKVESLNTLRERSWQAKTGVKCLTFSPGKANTSSIESSQT